MKNNKRRPAIEKCVFCGKEIPENSKLCPLCEQALISAIKEGDKNADRKHD